MTTRPILGIDFSGAALAGQKIWVARAQIEGENLVFHELRSAADLPGGAPERASALSALRAWIQTFPAPICGFDFPFSLEASEIDRPNWRVWALETPDRFAEANAFRAHYTGAKRQTDVAAKTPFSPLNLRLYRQTYWGIAHVLAPLIEAGALALPFESLRANATWLLEICPASLLKKHQLYFSYKGKSEAQRDNRARILSQIKARFGVATAPDMDEIALADTEGDALDAILSALCVARALERNQWKPRSNAEALEGRVYF